MSKFKKMTAVLLSVIMLVCIFSVPAGAASIADTAKSFSSGDTKTIKYSKNEYTTTDYSIKLSKTGNIVLSLSFNVSGLNLYLYDDNGNKYVHDEANVSSGSEYKSWSGYISCSWNKTVEKFKGTLTYKNMKKGTYYLRIEKMNIYGGGSGSTGKASIKITYPSADSSNDSKAVLNYISIPMEVGDTMQLSGVLSENTGEKVTWTSSKTSVAEIDSTGKVKAKKAGTSVITATLGKVSLKIQIKVAK